MDSALAIVDKRRTDINVAEVMHVIGDVRGRTCLVLDDLIDTAGTLVKNSLRFAGKRGVLGLFVARPMRWLSGPAVENIANSPLVEVGGDEHDSADGSGGEGAEDQGAVDCRIDWQRDPLDSRRDVGKQSFRVNSFL